MSSIESKIKALLEAADQPTAAQLAFPGATTPQDPAPYMGVNFEELEFDRPGVVTDEIQQAQYPGQTPQDPAPIAAPTQAIDPGQASSMIAQAQQPVAGIAGFEPSPLGAEFQEMDPYNVGAQISDEAAKENYPMGTGADDVAIAPDENGVADDEFSKGIKQAQQPAPGIAESVMSEEYTAHKPKRISAKSEGKIVVLDKATAETVEKKLGLPKGALSVSKGGKYSETAVVKGSDNKLHTVYSQGNSVRVRPYGHADQDSTDALHKHLNEAADANVDPQQQQDDILQQAIQAVQAGNKIEDVAKATGLDVQAIQDAIDAAQPTKSPAAPTTTAPVSESTGYYAKGTVGDKDFDINTQDAYDANRIKEQNPHLTDDEAKAVEAHTLTDEFVNGDSHTSTQNGHEVTVDENGGCSSCDTKVNESELKQDVESLLAEETLSEEFKAKAGSLFEAAVIARVNNEAQRIEESFNKKLEKEVQSLQEQYTQATETFAQKQSARLTNYINYLGEQWIKQNKVAVETGIKSELTEGFMSGLKQLFKEHYINVPQEKLELVEEQKSEIQKLQESLAELESEKQQLIESNLELQRNAIISELAEGLTDTEAAKLHSLCEGIDFDTQELFESKVQMIKTNFFKRKSIKSPEELLESTVHANQPQVDEPVHKQESPNMAAYVKALDRFKSF
jgi:hypothetical protein